MPKENLTVSMDSKLVRKLQDTSTEHDITVSSLVGDCVKRSISAVTSLISDLMPDKDVIGDEFLYYPVEKIVKVSEHLFLNEPPSMINNKVKVRTNSNDIKTVFSGTTKECQQVLMQLTKKIKEYKESEIIVVIPDIPKVKVGDVAPLAILAPKWNSISSNNELPDGWYVSQVNNEKLAPIDWEAHYSGSNGEIFLQPPGFNLVNGHLVPEEYSYLNGRIVEKKEDCQNE